MSETCQSFLDEEMRNLESAVGTYNRAMVRMLSIYQNLLCLIDPEKRVKDIKPPSQPSQSNSLVFIDDIFVTSKYEDLKILFDSLNQYGLVIKTTKFVFNAKEIEFLGYTVNSDGIKPLQEPETVK